MIGRTPWWRHVVVVGTVLLASLAVWAGWIGAPTVEERIEQLQVTITPVGENGLRFREVIDQDFGTHQRHGPQIILPTDFGTPENISASSPDAADDVLTGFVPEGFRIRIGDPDITREGQHRYVVTYTLPQARLATGELAVDAIRPGEIPVDNFEVVLRGLTLADARCNVGPPGTSGGCELDDGGAGYRARIPHLSADDAVTIGGRITGRTAAELPATPRLPERRDETRPQYALGTLVAGLLTAFLVHLWAARRGSNVVVGGGAAADAAFGGPATAGAIPPPPGMGAAPGMPLAAVMPGATRRVSDADLASLATIEFAPPPGIEPWQGAIALRERVDLDAQTAWFSGAAARDYLEIEGSGSGETTKLSPGPKRSEADAFSAAILDELFRGRASVSLGSYDSKFAKAWDKVADAEVAWAAGSGWWRSRPPQRTSGNARRLSGGCATALVVGTMALLVPVLAIAGVVLSAIDLIPWWLGLFAVAVLLPAAIARLAYAPLLPGRSAEGSAWALRTESFRRFLVASEGQHVEWAWHNGLVREYSAWAVALGAADAWRHAMETSGIPREEVDWSQTVLNQSMTTTFMSASTPPSTSSSSSGSSSSSSSFSSSSSGGGGGGGSHGSW